MTNTYHMFGEDFAADRELPFPSGEAGADSDAHRVEAHDELEASLELEALGQLQGGRCDIQYGGWLFALRPGDGYIWYQRRVLGEFDLPFEHVAERLIFPIYATLIADSRLAIHGSAVVVDGRAWVVTGDTEAGKSTTGYELMHRHGAALASDEAAVVDVDRMVLEAGAPAVRLDRAAGAIPEAVDEGPVHPELEKRWYRLDRAHLAEGDYPLGGVVYLAPDEEAGSEVFELERFGGSASLTRIVDQCFDFEQAPKRWRRRRFSNTAELVGGADVYRCRYGLSPDGSPTHVTQLWRRLSEEDA
jgi:hypothetical protein